MPPADVQATSACEVAESQLLCDGSDDSQSDNPRAAVGHRRLLAILGASLAIVAAASALTAHVGRGIPRKQPAMHELIQEDATGSGYVEAIYTFGAPPSANPALENLHSKDGCFAGLRSFNEDVVGPTTKQVDASAIQHNTLYSHAKMPVAVLHWGSASVYAPCPSGEPNWPGGAGVFEDWHLHWEKDYRPRLKNIEIGNVAVSDHAASKEAFDKAYKYSLLAFKVYDSTAKAKIAIANSMPGWKLVAKETVITGAGTLYDEDPVLLVQNSASLDCALVFAGTNNQDNEMASSSESYSTGYCGFNGIHTGYRNELWTMIKEAWPELRPKLSKCGTVSCTGHGFGGTLCEIFAACANSGRTGDPDYKQQAWSTGTPEAMDEIEKGSVDLAVGAVKRCEDPPCDREEWNRR